MTKNSKYTVIDLFCGCGGLSQGFIEADYNVLLGIDHWADALKTFKLNHKSSIVCNADLFTVSPRIIAKKTNISKVDVVIGGPPCQGFSIAGNRQVGDERNKLYIAFTNFISFYKPKVFLMENVPNIISIGKGLVKENIISDFQNLGYAVFYKVLLASNYGVPQNRRRAFFIGIKNNKIFNFPVKSIDRPVTTSEAISDLPEYELEDGVKFLSKPLNKYQKFIRGKAKALFNHQITKHSEQTVSIISLVPDGGNYKDLPENLQKTRNVNIAWTRLSSKKPSFTIDTGHRHHFHYKFNRVPTVRECARIQSFPDEFIFLGSKTSQYKQVGNAVPPLLAKALAIVLKKYL